MNNENSDAGDMKLSKLSFLYSLVKETAAYIPNEHEK